MEPRTWSIWSTATAPVQVRPLWWSKYLDLRAFLVFQRIQRFYSTFVILAALISGLAIGAMTFEEFHPSSGLIAVSEGLLCSSALTGILSAVMAAMLVFSFEGLERATRRDLAVAWMPLVLLDLSILEFLGGMVCWYCGKNETWQGALMATQLVVLVLYCGALSTWMWFYMSRTGGLGREEREAEEAHGPGRDK